MNYQTLKAAIDANIKENGQQLITGPILNSVLNQIVSALGEGYQFAGVAVPTTTPVTSDARVFFLAIEAGTYTNFGGKVLSAGNIGVLYYDTSWHISTLDISSNLVFATEEQINALFT